MKATIIVYLGLCFSLSPVSATAQTLPDVCACGSGEVLVCSTANPAGCELTVVVQQSAGTCTAEQRGKNNQGAEVAYCMVCVRRDPQGTAQAAPTLTWTLRPSTGTASFRSDRGILIAPMSDPKAEFSDKSYSQNLQKYTWKATLKNSSAAQTVTARVFGVDSSACSSSTSKIVNTDK